MNVEEKIQSLIDLELEEDAEIDEINEKFEEMGCDTSEEIDEQRMKEVGKITREFKNRKHEVFENLITIINEDAEKTDKLIVDIQNEKTGEQSYYVFDQKERYVITYIAMSAYNGNYGGGHMDLIGKNLLVLYSFKDKSYGKVKQHLDDFENIEVLLVNDGESESNEKVYVVGREQSQNLFNQFAELNSDSKWYMRGNYTDHNVFDWDGGDIYRDVCKFVKANA